MVAHQFYVYISYGSYVGGTEVRREVRTREKGTSIYRGRQPIEALPRDVLCFYHI
jgi:hypothetical protein